MQSLIVGLEGGLRALLLNPAKSWNKITLKLTLRDVGATTYPCKNLSFCSLSSSAFVGTQKPVLPQLLGLLVNPQETFQVLLMMLQLVAGQTDVTPHRTSRVHTEGTVGGSDLENKALVFSLRLLKQSKGRGIQGSCDREKGLFP